MSRFFSYLFSICLHVPTLLSLSLHSSIFIFTLHHHHQSRAGWLRRLRRGWTSARPSKRRRRAQSKHALATLDFPLCTSHTHIVTTSLTDTSGQPPFNSTYTPSSDTTTGRGSRARPPRLSVVVLSRTQMTSPRTPNNSSPPLIFPSSPPLPPSSIKHHQQQRNGGSTPNSPRPLPTPPPPPLSPAQFATTRGGGTSGGGNWSLVGSPRAGGMSGTATPTTTHSSRPGSTTTTRAPAPPADLNSLPLAPYVLAI